MSRLPTATESNISLITRTLWWIIISYNPYQPDKNTTKRIQNIIILIAETTKFQLVNNFCLHGNWVLWIIFHSFLNSLHRVKYFRRYNYNLDPPTSTLLFTGYFWITFPKQYFGACNKETTSSTDINHHIVQEPSAEGGWVAHFTKFVFYVKRPKNSVS